MPPTPWQLVCQRSRPGDYHTPYRCCSGLDIGLGLGLEVYEAKSFIPRSKPRPRPQYSRPRPGPEDCVLEAPRSQVLVLEDTPLRTTSQIIPPVHGSHVFEEDTIKMTRIKNLFAGWYP